MKMKAWPMINTTANSIAISSSAYRVSLVVSKYRLSSEINWLLRIVVDSDFNVNSNSQDN